MSVSLKNCAVKKHKKKTSLSNQSEKLIETEILIYLNYKLRFYAWKNNSTGVFDPVKKVYRKSKNKFAINGVSDILFYGRDIQNRPVFGAIEVKTPKRINQKSATTNDQRKFIEVTNEFGHIAFLADSIERVETELRARGVID